MLLACGVKCHAQEAAPTSSLAARDSGDEAVTTSQSAESDAKPAPATADPAADPGAGEGRCQPATVLRLFAGRTFELDQSCPHSHSTLALQAPSRKRNGGWGSLIPGQPGLGLLRHGEVKVGDRALSSAGEPPEAVRSALQLPEPQPNIELREYRVEPSYLRASLRQPRGKAKDTAVAALRLPDEKVVLLRVERVHRYLEPWQLAATASVKLVIPHGRVPLLAGLLPLLGGVAGIALGAGLLYADAQREDRGWLPSLELMAGQILLITGPVALLGGATLLGVRAARRYPAEL